MLGDMVTCKGTGTGREAEGGDVRVPSGTGTGRESGG
jgi:hypothetical protein